MKIKPYILVSVGILVVGGIYVFNQLRSIKNNPTKAQNIETIISAGKHGNKEFISSFDADFLTEWAKAVKNNSETFTYKDKQYKTQGGTSVK
jgi:hypothetical protein